MFAFLFATSLAIQIFPPDSDAPARAPQMAASGSRVALAFGSGQAIYTSVSSDSGKSFAPPVKVTQAGILPLNRHRGPRVAFAGDAIIITAVSGKQAAEGPHAHGLPSDGDLLVWRSMDSGKSWKKSGKINDVTGAPTEGLHSLATGPGGRLYAAWLDKRSGHGTAIFGAQSTDGGLTWSQNVKIYESPEGTVCECCHPSAAFDAQGGVSVMFRNWLGGARDMHLARSGDGVHFAKPEKLGRGTWTLNACPMDGGGLVVAGDRIVSAWRRDGVVYLATPGQPEAALGKGVDVSLAAVGNGVYAVWSNPEGIFASAPGQSAPKLLSPAGGFPNIVSLPGGRALVAWELDGKIAIQDVRP